MSKWVRDVPQLSVRSGTLQMQFQLPGVARDFSAKVNFQCRRFMVFVQPPCAIEYINVCAHIKNPKLWQSYHCLDTQKYSTHQVNSQRWKVAAQKAGGWKQSLTHTKEFLNRVDCWRSERKKDKKTQKVKQNTF